MRAREKFTKPAGNERSSRETGWQRAKTRDGGERQGRRISDPGLIRATCTATPLASRLHLCARFSLDSQRSYSLRTAPSEATYSHCTLPRNTCAPSPITPTASQSRRHTVRRAGSANGAAVVFLIATPYSTPDPFTAFPFWRKSDVQDTVCDVSPTTTRSVLSNALLRRSIPCSILGAFRAAPPARCFFVRVWRSAQCPNARRLY